MAQENIQSTLEILDVQNKSCKLIYKADYHFEAPNWTNDGKWLIFNSNGSLYKISIEGGIPEKINSGFADKCNNDHLLSPDNKFIAVSHHTHEDGISRIYTYQFNGSVPKLITKNGPSYLHGWSPDGKTLAYCAQRNGKFGIFVISSDGGEEKRLTETSGLDDGPEFSPDGKYIYFNSDRTGLMQIYRIKTDGSSIEQITTDDGNNWFAHIAPDNSKFIFLTYDKSVQGHPANKNVKLRLMSLLNNEITVVADLFGGQGTINVPSWSADSKRVAFVRYKLL